jgi:hypothetical protein
MTENQKRKYLALYDYQTGGVWVFIYARSEAEVLAKYPEMRIMDERANSRNLYPPSISDEERAKIERSMTYDIDDPPSGFLRSLVDNR